MQVCDGIVEAIGNTPLIKLKRVSAATGCTILGKAEFMNPGQSVKDRAALFIIQDAVKRGALRPGGVIVEGTAGNTGIGLALVGNALGFRSVIVIPETQSQEKKDTLRLCGAELIEVPAVPYSNPNNYVKLSGRLAEQLAKSEKNGAIWANQFDNVANRQGHIETTGPEIWRQTDGKVDGFVCAVGTGGTLAGVAMALKAYSNAVRIALADPMGAALYSYYTTGKLKSEGSSITEGIGQGRITKNLEGAPIDIAYQIPDEEAVPIIFDLLEHEGLCLGGSSGINVAGAVRLAKELGPGHTIVTILADYGTRYQSKLFNPAFLREKKLPVPHWLERQIGASRCLFSEPTRVASRIRCHCHAQTRRIPLPPPRPAAGSFRPNGLPNICATATSSWSTAASSCRRRSATRMPNIATAIFPARCSSTSRRSPIIRPNCRTCCRARRNSAKPPARSASAMATPSSSMTASASIRRRGCGGRSGSSAPRKSSSSMADCRDGKPKDVRWKRARRSRLRKNSHAEMNVGAVAMLADVRMALVDDSAQVVDARPADRFAGKAPEPRPGLALGPHAALVQRALCARLSKTADWSRARASRRRLRMPASISTSRSSPRAAPA